MPAYRYYFTNRLSFFRKLETVRFLLFRPGKVYTLNIPEIRYN
ncbi:hypothetical protein LEP1GSC188_1625 [Leptospira weilii serovar Topaz str. LT2116]|uniref:Uncharacterized protein n=5 Tax=Leptospira weilii TaxID=28184 RepID=M3EEZ3_9LEPT|nr:hypothetical protein LEP1GSC036_1432 [Leptospira weilii str. 2006001853]EMF79638.1 hypothetical protein LEP1GSC188_1625 [Leptospira weilii serovar Topaz str. LT2116]EMJ60128.1 hypothetical protein LEP1GSC051_1615 [Leptospira sp. P2653]EMM74268.1 hypothetical protein LEP1GSC038_4725 [Leptospira weilii str. 2006001855]EMN45953.1 hypothetical protein LEP1GSC086_2182 [Leptospira weilii str. LNT 1234]EMN91681.1 hypothetical protein LEP1GSC108_1837 [Leptospira weilii str. UI 13098]EMY14098.1 hyp